MGGRLTVLFVDDNSPDGTGEEIRRPDGEHPRLPAAREGGQEGAGHRLHRRLPARPGEPDPEIVVQMDADLQHPPEMLESLVAKVASGVADVAIASRHVNGGSFKGLNWRRRMISKGASWLSRTVLGLKVKDTTTGFKALRRSAVECLLAHPPRSAGFIFQVESLYILKKNGFKMVEVPFTFEERAKGASKMGAARCGSSSSES